MRRLGIQSFKVIADIGMDDDADDDLILDQKNPGAPTAFKERAFTFVDLKNPAKILMMKYERA